MGSSGSKKIPDFERIRIFHRVPLQDLRDGKWKKSSNVDLFYTYPISRNFSLDIIENKLYIFPTDYERSGHDCGTEGLIWYLKYLPVQVQGKGKTLIDNLYVGLDKEQYNALF